LNIEDGLGGSDSENEFSPQEEMDQGEPGERRFGPHGFTTNPTTTNSTFQSSHQKEGEDEFRNFCRKE
jgi:hypothetical protein